MGHVHAPLNVVGHINNNHALVLIMLSVHYVRMYMYTPYGPCKYYALSTLCTVIRIPEYNSILLAIRYL